MAVVQCSMVLAVLLPEIRVRRRAVSISEERRIEGILVELHTLELERKTES